MARFASPRPGRGLAVAALTLALVGCGKPTTSTVSGQVLLDGELLAKGSIRFVPAEGSGATAAAIIENGRYRAEMPPGRKKVEISAMKSVGKRQVYRGDPNSPVVDDVRESLPAEYNAATTLTIDAAAGRVEKDFPLKSKP